MSEEAQADGIPPWQDFMKPLLECLVDGEPHSRREITLMSLDIAGITPDQKTVMLKSGQSKAANRSAWAITHLTQSGAIQRTARATFAITDFGRGLLHDAGTRPNQAAAYVASHLNTSAAPETTFTPIDRVEQAIAAIDGEVGEVLLQRLRESHPDFFEQAVVDLLLKMGYGGAEQRGRRIGGSGDGGVDGVIDQDALGLERIYVQAKRYADGNTVGRETIQAFVGALHGVGASRGVFITTSTFTSGAKQYAEAVPSRIILIDSPRLVNLMIKYRVGVQVKQSYDVVELDEDFFE